MTEADALVYLRSIRDDYQNRLYIGMTPQKAGDYLPINGSKFHITRQYYQDRIEAIDVAIVYLSLKV